MAIGVLGVAAVGEATAGVILLVYPRVFVHLLFGTEASGATGVMSRIAGMALIALGVACWPGRARTTGGSPRALLAMLSYSLLVTVYFLYLAAENEWVGPLLWPAAVLHAVLGLLLVRAAANGLSERSSEGSAPNS